MILLGANLRAGCGVGDFSRRVAGVWQSEGERCGLWDRRGREGDEATAEAAVFLQFVPYAWHPRGLIGPSVRREILARCEGRRTTVFMHELWVGESKGDATRDRWLGFWQRRGVLRLLRELRPAAVMTSNAVYQAMLAREGFVAERWSLPGNLPRPTEAEEEQATGWWRERGLDGVEVAAAFGSIHPEWDGAAALRSWRGHLAAKGREGVVLTLGRNGPAAEAVWGRLAEAAAGLRIERGGPMAAGLLAAVLAKVSLGLATTPWALIDKSGTVAAFRELGVPVLVTRDDWRWRRGETPRRAEEAGLRRWRDGLDWDGLLAERVVRSEDAARGLVARLRADARRGEG